MRAPRLLALTLILASLTGCPAETMVGSGPCSPGARVCEGSTVLLCSGAVSQFVVERECTGSTTCMEGECRPRFVGGADATAPDIASAPDSQLVEDTTEFDITTTAPDVLSADSGAPDVVAPHDSGAADAQKAPDAADTAGDAIAQTDATENTLDTGEDAAAPIDVGADDVAPPDTGEHDASPSPFCGDGALDPGETCDPGVAGGPGACPTECGDLAGCATYVLDGAAFECTATCTKVLETEPLDGDDCCPAGATPETDSDCAGSCGDGKKDPWEACDGADLGFATCGFSGVLPSCLPDCTLSTLPCPGSHMLVYEKVKNLLVKGDMQAVRWHTSGAFALLLGPKGEVVRYEAATGDIAVVTTLDGAVDLDIDPSGVFFLFVGQGKDQVSRIWRATVAEDLTVTFAPETTLSNGKPVAILATGWDGVFIIAAQGASYINYLYAWRDDGKAPVLKGYNNPGVVDVMFGFPGKFFGEPTVFTADGWNGAGSTSWILSTGEIVPNGWSAGFGNAGGAAWRPGGTYGIVCGTSSNKLYVFHGGTWEMATLPNTNNGANPLGISWKKDGSRALIVGNVTGNPSRAIVMDHRPAGAEAFDVSTVVDMSIPNWSSPPWYGSSYAALLDADWRPGACDEGLIVGADAGSSFTPDYATILRFRDQDDPDCAP